MTDYYKILGVEHDASDDDIRKAYRKLSRKYHPDIAGQEFEEKFKEVNNAYDVLSNPEKRRMVDMGVDPNSPSASAGPGGAAGYADMGDIFSQFFTGSFGGSHGPTPRVHPGDDTLAEARIDLKTAIFGGVTKIRVTTFGLCQDCSGSGSSDGSQPTVCPQCHGSGYLQKVVRTMLGQMMSTAPCEHCEGHGNVIEHVCPNCQGHGRVRTVREVGVNIPAGIRDDSRLRLASQGAVGECGGPAGDLYVDIHIHPDRLFTRDGDDLHCWIDVPMTWAALGHELTIETFDGTKKITIPAGLQHGQTIILDDLGARVLRSQTERGKLVVHINVIVPTKMSQEEEDLLRKFARLHDAHMPDIMQRSFTHSSGERKSFFSKLKDAFTA